MIPGILALAALATLEHGAAAHRHAPSLPRGPLQWGDINFLQTTDTHGWLLGHQKNSEPEPNASGDWGDYASFVQHMRAQADERGVDLLVIDSGDLHDGSGLSDGFPPGGVNGHETDEIFAELDVDLLTIGNHGLYKSDVALDIYRSFAPKWGGRYLTSNVNITVPGSNESRPIGDRFRKFVTKQGRNVTAFGFLYNFKYGTPIMHVQSTAKMVHEQWFQEAIAEEPSFFLLNGHVPVRDPSWEPVFAAIRAVHPHTPIIAFGGHYHIRDCRLPDERSILLAGGRYMETIGFVSANLTAPSFSSSSLPVFRRYLDANPVTYRFHARVRDLSTALGNKIKSELWTLWARFGLGEVYGSAPHDYYVDRVPYPDEKSVLSLYGDLVLPATVVNQSRPHDKIVFLNSGAQRFDIYKGTLTRNDRFVTTPFKNQFLYFPAVPYSIASKILPALNALPDPHFMTFESVYGEGSRDLNEQPEGEEDVELVFQNWKRSMYDAASAQPVRRDHSRDLQRRTLGYVTVDSCPGHGDDTAHDPIPVFPQPVYIASPDPLGATDDTPIDVVFADFVLPDLQRVLEQLAPAIKWGTAQVYSSVTSDEALAIYARQAWSGSKKE